MKKLNITFLIGNGFDLNLGLDTLYSDFVNHYKNLETDDEDLRKFRKHINENEELWSNAEWELGQYTNELGKGEASIFTKCQSDFCVNLAEYLEKQEGRLDWSSCSSAISAVFSKIERLTQPFVTKEKDIIEDAYKKRRNEERCYRFINFNYTRTLDDCIDIVKDDPNVLKSHSYGNSICEHKITEVVHVHGTVEKDMVFAVNDESQVAKIDVFDCTYGEICKNLLIKRKANSSYGEYADEKARRLIESSHIIYVYGMSFGDTDKLWWERVCTWLSQDTTRHLIVHKFYMPQRSVFPGNYQIAEQEYKDFITAKSTLDEKGQRKIQQQIHITNYNIFSNIKFIAVPLEKAKKSLGRFKIADLEKELAEAL